MTGNLTVGNKSNGANFKVRIPNGTVIQNFKGETIPMTAGLVQTKVNNGHVKNYYRQEKTEYETKKVPQTFFQKIHNLVTTGKTEKTVKIAYPSVDKDLTPQTALNLSSGKYGMFEKIRKLDGNPGDISQKDLEKLRKTPSLWKEDGISKVKYDAKTHTTGIYADPKDQNPLIFKFNK